MISNLKIRYSIFLEEPNKTCDSSNPSATTASIQPNLEHSHSSSELSSSQSEPAKAADDPENGERESHVWGVLWASLVGQMVKYLPAMWEIQVQSLGWDNHLEKGMATLSRILA